MGSLAELAEAAALLLAAGVAVVVHGSALACVVASIAKIYLLFPGIFVREDYFLAPENSWCDMFL